MKNYIGSADRPTITAPVDLVSGTVYVDKGMVFVAEGNATAGDKTSVCTRGEFSLPKVDGTAATNGDLAYWDLTNDEVTPTSAAAHVLIGYFNGAAASGDTTARVIVTGIPAETVAGNEPAAEA